MGLLATPLAGVAAKEIIERVIEIPAPPVTVDKHPEYHGKGLTHYATTKSEVGLGNVSNLQDPTTNDHIATTRYINGQIDSHGDLQDLIRTARIRNANAAVAQLIEYSKTHIV